MFVLYNLACFKSRRHPDDFCKRNQTSRGWRDNWKCVRTRLVLIKRFVHFLSMLQAQYKPNPGVEWPAEVQSRSSNKAWRQWSMYRNNGRSEEGEVVGSSSIRFWSEDSTERLIEVETWCRIGRRGGGGWMCGQGGGRTKGWWMSSVLWGWPLAHMV